MSAEVLLSWKEHLETDDSPDRPHLALALPRFRALRAWRETPCMQAAPQVRLEIGEMFRGL